MKGVSGRARALANSQWAGRRRSARARARLKSAPLDAALESEFRRRRCRRLLSHVLLPWRRRRCRF